MNTLNQLYSLAFMCKYLFNIFVITLKSFMSDLQTDSRQPEITTAVCSWRVCSQGDFASRRRGLAVNN